MAAATSSVSLARLALELVFYLFGGSARVMKAKPYKLIRGKTYFNCLLVGEVKVGKTELWNRFVRNSFKAEYKATIGADFISTFDPFYFPPPPPNTVPYTNHQCMKPKSCYSMTFV